MFVYAASLSDDSENCPLHNVPLMPSMQHDHHEYDQDAQCHPGHSRTCVLTVL